MSCDMFSSAKARQLLTGKTVYFFGDSNIRAVYKDLIWLFEDGRLIPNAKLKSKNELSHANDVRLSNGRLHGGRNYKEVRSYSENPYITFHFLTRLYLPDFIETIKNLKSKPDVLVINSCVWDLTRWGSNGVEQFKENVKKTFSFLKTNLPKTRIIWLTTLPPSFKSHGGFLTKEIEFMRNMLPWHILFANKHASDLALSYNIDVLDLHYNFRFLLNYHSKDGIHWASKAVRHATNLLLTHIALCWDCKLPGNFELDQTFLTRSQSISNTTEIKSSESNANCSTPVNKKKRSRSNAQRKRARERRLSNSYASNNSGKLVNQHNQGESFQPPINVWNWNNCNPVYSRFTTEPVCSRSMFSDGNKQPWHEDYTIDNFQNFSILAENQHSFWQDPYANDNLNSVFKFNSQVLSCNGNFRDQRNVHNRGRIEKRNPYRYK